MTIFKRFCLWRFFTDVLYAMLFMKVLCKAHCALSIMHFVRLHFNHDFFCYIHIVLIELTTISVKITQRDENKESTKATLNEFYAKVHSVGVCKNLYKFIGKVIARGALQLSLIVLILQEALFIEFDGVTFSNVCKHATIL